MLPAIGGSVRPLCCYSAARTAELFNNLLFSGRLQPYTLARDRFEYDNGILGRYTCIVEFSTDNLATAPIRTQELKKPHHSAGLFLCLNINSLLTSYRVVYILRSCAISHFTMTTTRKRQTMSTLKTVGMELIHVNPYRLVASYPYNEAKIGSLVRSIKDVGFWEGVIVRPNPYGEGYQLAFGHHRIEAAKRAGLNRAPVIVRDLTDEQMVQFMGRENGEDYKADFITMLNTWEGAAEYLRRARGASNDTEIAKTLGWTHKRSDSREGRSDRVVMNRVAESCAHAHSLIEAGHMKIKDFAGMSVSAVRELVAPAVKEIKKAEKTADPDEVKEVTKKATAAVREVAANVRQKGQEGTTLGDIRSQSRSKIRERITPNEDVLPEFESFTRRAQKAMENLFMEDTVTVNVESIIDASPFLVNYSDMQAVDALIIDMRDALNRGRDLLNRLEKTASDRRPVATDTPALPHQGGA